MLIVDFSTNVYRLFSSKSHPKRSLKNLKILLASVTNMNNNFSSFSKPFRFEHFSKSVQQCNLCQRAYSSLKVLSDRNGNIYSKIIFIAEAPGRLGAEKTGIPLCGDKTGENFELLLKNIGWNRNDIFITNAILCNPKIESGNNATPNLEEIKNCSFFLMMTINLINPDLIVTLGPFP